jgi:Leucine-rich repeat (LRR) protein
MWYGDWKSLKHFVADFSYAEITRLKWLSEIKTLEKLTFTYYMEASLEWFKCIGNLTNLTWLDIQRAQFSVSLLEDGHFDSLKKLQTFRCKDTTLSNNLIDRIGRTWSNLTQLHLISPSNKSIASFSVQKLQCLSQLQTLFFYNIVWLTDNVLARLIRYHPPRLHNLSVSGPQRLTCRALSLLANASISLQLSSFEGSWIFATEEATSQEFLSAAKSLVCRESLFSFGLLHCFESTTVRHDNTYHRNLEFILKQHVDKNRSLQKPGCHIVCQA